MYYEPLPINPTLYHSPLKRPPPPWSKARHEQFIGRTSNDAYAASKQQSGETMTRNALIEQIQIAVTAAGDHPPVVAFDDYFDGNDQEDSIAPNQAGCGRPNLADLYHRLREINQRDDVQTVLVSVHDDWIEAVNSSDVWPAGDCVHIYTSAPQSDAESWIEGLASDGLIEGWQRGRGAHPQAPAPVPPNRILTIVWD